MTRLLPLALLVPLLGGCDGWPLYLNLPSPDPGPGEASRLSVTEDEQPDEAIQVLGALTPPSVVTIQGTADACGFDEDASGPIWPNHPVDTDGDGGIDGEEPRYTGWFTGDVDLYRLDVSADAWLLFELTWDNAPDGEANAPYLPTDETAPWATETDLDWLVRAVEGEEAAEIVSDLGFSPAYPQTSPHHLAVGPEDARAVAVGCHHGLPSAYTLVVEVLAR